MGLGAVRPPAPPERAVHRDSAAGAADPNESAEHGSGRRRQACPGAPAALPTPHPTHEDRLGPVEEEPAVKLAPDPMPPHSDSRPQPVSMRPRANADSFPLGARVVSAASRLRMVVDALAGRVDAAWDHPAAIGATDRELARLSDVGWSVEDARTDSLRRLGVYRRPAG